MTVLDAGSQVTLLRFLPDGRLVVGLRSKTADGSLEIWPLPSGERVRIPLPDQMYWYREDQLAFSPVGDRLHFACGRLLTFATADGGPAAGPTPPFPDPDDPAAPGHAQLMADRVIVSPNGRMLVAAQGQTTDPWWLVAFAADGSLIRHKVYPPPGPQFAGFLPDGEQYVDVCGNTAAVRRFDAAGELLPARVPSNHGRAPQLSPDGRHLGVSGYGSLYVYDTAALGKPRQIKGSGNFGNFIGFAFHPGGRTLAVIHGGPTLVKLYDLDTLKLRSKLNWKVGALTCVAYSPDGLLAAAGTEDGRVVVWDVDE